MAQTASARPKISNASGPPCGGPCHRRYRRGHDARRSGLDARPRSGRGSGRRGACSVGGTQGFRWLSRCSQRGLAGTVAEKMLIIVGPSLGTAVGTLWGPCAAQLVGFEVVGWDLPGHGLSRPAAEGFTVKDLAASVRALAIAAAACGRRADRVYPRWCGGVRARSGPWPIPCSRCRGGCVTHRRGVLVDRAGRTRPQGRYVGYGGRFLSAVVRPRFSGARRRHRRAVLQTPSDTDDESYSLACEALAEFDRRPDLDRVTVPFLLGPGEHDGVVPPARAQQDADAIAGSRLQVFAGCGHLPPAESRVRSLKH